MSAIMQGFGTRRWAKRLARSVELGFLRMETLRRSRYKFIAQAVGPFYSRHKTASGDMEEKKASPINLMYNAITTMVPNLVYNKPKVRIRTEILPYRSYADTWEAGTNHLAQKIDLRMTLRKTVTDSLFGAGIVKTGIAAGGQTLNLEGKLHNIGAPYADRVDFDDLLIDPVGRDWDELMYQGNRFQMQRDDLMEMGIYPPDKIKQLTSRFDGAGKFRTEVASLSSQETATGEAEAIGDYVDLVEIYVPGEQVIVTMPYGTTYDDGDILNVVDYEGPERGPYHLLGYAYVPDNPMPVPPASIWYYLHILANRIARKISRQAERAKRVLAYERSSEDDAQEIVDADDGDTVGVDHIDAIKEVGYGGTNEDAYKYMEWVTQEFSKQAGNINLLGGVAADQPTATQSEMLNNNNSIRLEDQKNIVYVFTSDVMGDLAFFLHTDPLVNMTLARRVGGVDTQVRYTPEMRQGDFADYAFHIEPYSMARQDPNVKLQRVLQFVSSALPAMAQSFQLLGPAFNLEGCMNLVLREMQIDEGDEIINSQMLQQRIAQMMATVPPDGALGAQLGVPPAGGGPPGPPGAAPPLPGGGRPQQPNPMQMGPTNGVMPDTMQRQRQQETAGQLQATYTAR